MKKSTIAKRIIDVALTVTLLLLMAFQLTVNILLLLSFVCTALSGMMMTRFATPFMNGILPASVVRQGHLAMSHWSFVLMGLHLGLHFGIITSKLRNKTAKIIPGIVMTGISVYGFYLFFRSGMLNYMLFKNPFAFLDYSKAWWLVILENLAMLLAWGFAAYLLSLFLRSITKKENRKAALLYALLLVAVVVGGIVLNAVMNPAQENQTAPWAATQNISTQSNVPTQAVNKEETVITDNYILISGGGRFGQSLTAIAKLAPNSDIGEGLSVHYSGGATLSDDVATWLQATGMK